jgi:signal transduction histidine kinase
MTEHSPLRDRLRDRAGGLGVEGLGPATILAILVLGSALSVYVWRDLDRQWQGQIDSTSAGFASRLRGTVADHVDALYAELRRRGRFWNSAAFRNDRGLWSEDAESFLADNPSVLAVVRSAGDWQLAGSPEAKRALFDALPEIRRRQPEPDGDFVSDPIGLASGRTVVGMQVALATGDGETHAVFALVDPARLVEEAIGNRAPLYGVSVSAGEERVFERTPPGPALDRWRKSEVVGLPLGRTWTLDTWPTADAISSPTEQGPLIALVGGVLASTLIAVSLHFGTLAWRRERALRGINASLAAQVGETLRGQDELRRLSAELEARVAERTVELNETIIELETFNYSASHDLRGPLGAIINFAAILKEDYGDRLGRGVEHLDRIVNSATAAVSMMDALLAYSRSGRTELRKQRLDMGSLVRDVIAEVTASTPGLNSSVSIGDLPDAFADENLTRLVVTNLIGNAFKFVRPGEKPQVEISGSVDRHEVAYLVRDQGVGFDMRFADKLFRVFERLHTSADGYQGHGVGLAIVARVVRRHGGRVWAQSAEGRGATFHFTLPRVEDDFAGEHGRPA